MSADEIGDKELEWQLHGSESRILSDTILRHTLNIMYKYCELCADCYWG
jgi:hypothetical protein